VIKPTKLANELQGRQVRHCAAKRIKVQSTKTPPFWFKSRSQQFAHRARPPIQSRPQVSWQMGWLDVLPSIKPNLAALLWALGFHWNRRRGVWKHSCGSFDPLGYHPTDPRAKYRSYFPADVLPA